MVTDENDGDETLAELFAGREELDQRWSEWLQACACPPPAPPPANRVRITVDVDLSNADISTTLTVRPPVPLMTVAHTLRLLAEAIETGQINSLQLPKA